MIRGLFHPEPFRLLPFDHRQGQPAQDEQEYKVHDEPEKRGNREDLEKKYKAVVYEKLQEYGIIRGIYMGTMVDPGFQVPDHDEQDPAKGKAHVHVSKQRITLP